MRQKKRCRLTGAYSFIPVRIANQRFGPRREIAAFFVRTEILRVRPSNIESESNHRSGKISNGIGAGAAKRNAVVRLLFQGFKSFVDLAF